MSYQESTGKPVVTLDGEKIERSMANYASTKGWSTDADFSAGVEGLTDTQAVQLMRRFLKAIVRLQPAAIAPNFGAEKQP